MLSPRRAGPGDGRGRRPVARSGLLLTLCTISALSLAACGGKRPSQLGVAEASLAPCPSSPNCVSSDERDPDHHADAFSLSAPPDAAWRVVREEIDRLPRTTVVGEAPGYLHVECKSALFRFVDDLELHLRASDGLVAVRSASRVGHSDLGVNRRRVERLRVALRARGVVP